MIRVQIQLFTTAALLFACAAPASCLDLVKSGGLFYEGTATDKADEEVILAMENGSRTFRKSQVQELIMGKGIEEYVTALTDALPAEDADGRADIAILASRSGKKEFAEGLLRKVLEIDPANARAGRALRWDLVSGKYVQPSGAANSGGAKGDENATDAAASTAPLVGYSVDESIDGINYQDFLLRNPNPAYRASVGSQLAGSLFGHEHKWKIIDLENKKFKPTLKAKMALKTVKTKTTTYQTIDVQTFYAAEVTLELTRISDGVRVLYVTSEVERGHRDRSTAARNSFLDACNAIVKSPEVQKAALWADPATAPEMKNPIKITKKGS